MAPTQHPFFDPAQAATFDELRYKTDSTFEITYYAAHGLAGPLRALLAIVGAKFKNRCVSHVEWPGMSQISPFGLIPILKETSPDGKSIEIAESDVIERYLSKKFNIMGDNWLEELTISQILNNNVPLWVQFRINYYLCTDPVRKEEEKQVLIRNKWPVWVKHHERHLAANGYNGYYVGNRISAADIHAATMFIPSILAFTGNDLISETLTPGLWKLQQTVEAIPSYIAWKETEEYKAFDELNRTKIGYGV